MPEWVQQERLQPSLLDRLTDEEPTKSKEGRERRVLSTHKLRQSVLRDLSWLFNTRSLEMSESLDGFPLVKGSVLNYGTPELAGRAFTGKDDDALERVIRQAIRDFEPRILRETLKVRSIRSEGSRLEEVLGVEIEGELWGQPLPEHLLLETDIDRDMGSATVKEGGANRGRK